MNISDIKRISDLNSQRNKLLNDLDLINDKKSYISILIDNNRYPYDKHTSKVYMRYNEDNVKWIKDIITEQLNHVENKLIELGVTL